MLKSTASIVRACPQPVYEEVLVAVREALELMGGLAGVVNQGELVLINPFWVASPAGRETGTCTWPEVSRVVAALVKEGVGPVFGDPVEMDLILASKDLVAADTISGLLIGYDPSEVKLTVEADTRGLGEMEL